MKTSKKVSVGTFIKQLDSLRKKSNEKFEKLSQKQKRIHIAKDALAQIMVKNIIPKNGTYCEIDAKEGEKKINHRDQLQDVLKMSVVECTACALGALFVAHVDLTNKCSVGNADGECQGRMHDRLSECFAVEQLELIENYFERSTGFDSARTRLIRILKNIIKNDGRIAWDRGASRVQAETILRISAEQARKILEIAEHEENR